MEENKKCITEGVGCRGRGKEAREVSNFSLAGI